MVLLADGVRPDTLRAAASDPAFPELARLAREGGIFDVTTCFPSVTGPAYVPFLVGVHPATVGLPGLRWYDRARTSCSFPDYARSYVGYQARYLDKDLDPAIPTLFERVPDSVGALSVITRGLPKRARIGTLSLRDPLAVLRAARTHFSGDLPGWLSIDRDIAAEVSRRVREERPAFTFAALMGVDKVSHAFGQGSELTRHALATVDDLVGTLRADAEHCGDWEQTHLWIASDHGHSPVETHEDLAGFVTSLGYRVVAHPNVLAIAPDVAVMVSGNAMAHLYVELGRRTRPAWEELRGRWSVLTEALLERRSVDLLIVRTAADQFEVHGRDRGVARIRLQAGGYSYRRVTGDPLGLACDVQDAGREAAYHATLETDYPDALVQIAELLRSQRAGDIVVSASREWDFRSKHEPIPHVSSHGALHRDHMMVPLLLNRPPRRAPARTMDIAPSILAALGLAADGRLQGVPFL